MQTKFYFLIYRSAFLCLALFATSCSQSNSRENKEAEFSEGLTSTSPSCVSPSDIWLDNVLEIRGQYQFVYQWNSTSAESYSFSFSIEVEGQQDTLVTTSIGETKFTFLVDTAKVLRQKIIATVVAKCGDSVASSSASSKCTFYNGVVTDDLILLAIATKSTTINSICSEPVDCTHIVFNDGQFLNNDNSSIKVGQNHKFKYYKLEEVQGCFCTSEIDLNKIRNCLNTVEVLYSSLNHNNSHMIELCSREEDFQ